LYFLFLAQNLKAQDNFPVGSRAAALANAVVMDTGLWAISHNQAGLGNYKNFSIGFHHENKYVVKEHSLHSLALSVPVKGGTLGFIYSYFGYLKYNENKIGFAFGKSFGGKISAGVQLNYHYVYNEGEYENLHAVTVEGGIQYKPINTIRIGIHLFNPSQSKLSPTNLDTLITTLRAGVSYSPIEKLWMAIETEKNLSYHLRIKSGIEYEVTEGLFLRTGILTHPVQNTFGLGFQIGRINADVAFSHSQTLGFTPHFSMHAKLR
jgi:hypothetical protein